MQYPGKKPENKRTGLRLLRYGDLVEMGIVANRVTLRRWIQSGDFPRPIYLGPNTIAWRAEAVERWLSRREQGR